MASGTSPSTKRNSFQRLSSIFQLASPSFVRLSFDASATTERKKPPGTSPKSQALGAGTSALPPHEADVVGHGNDPGPAPSILSTADSSLSSPLSPLLPATPTTFWSAGELPVPLTSNDLAAGEKAMLMRKMRKLSQVLGEVPNPRVVEEDDAEALERSRLSAVLEDDAKSVMSSPRMGSVAESAKSAKRAFRRSFTVGATPSMGAAWQKHVPRVKSLSSLRPSLKIASSGRRSVDGPSSPIIFAWPDGDMPGDTPSPSAPTSPHPDAGERGPPSAFQKFSRRKDSTASSVLLADQNTEQVQRARVAKLSRYLGESVPPEILRRAASPPRSTSPAPSSQHAATLEKLSAASPQRIRTPSPRPRRPLSLDFRSLRSAGTSSAPSTPPAHVASHFSSPPRKLRRTRSLWAKGASDADEETYDEEPKPSEPLSEKQRMRNVIRARKMAQLFGDNPPSALFQITSLSGGSNLHVDEFDGQRGRQRDSLTTIISISATSLALSQPCSPTRCLRDSYISMVTTSSEMSALIVATEPNERKPSLERSRSFSAPERPPAARPSLGTGLSEPNLKCKTGRPRTADSSMSALSERRSPPRLLPVPSSAVIHQPPRTPPTPPPFSDFLPTPMSWPTVSPPVPPTTEEFQARRRRAAKLSRFFGVEVGQLAEVLPPDIPAPAVPAKAVLAQEQAVLPEVIQIQRPVRRPSTTVAEAKNRRRFLSSNEADNVKEVDVTEVMDQLRRMRNR